MSTLKTICLAGDGWGAIAAFESLAESVESIQVVTEDNDLLCRLRPSDTHHTELPCANVDLVICAGYKPIIAAEVLKKVTHINVHYSLLPKYRGMHSTVWALLNGEEHCGCTIHLMNEFVDDGPILAQFCTTTRNKSATEIIEECNSWVRDNLDTVVVDYRNKKLIPVEQDKSLATWVPKRNFEDCLIDFNATAVEIERMLRALVYPYPIPRFRHNGVVYEIVGAKVIYRPYFCTNGRVVNIDNEGIWIKISDGLLLVNELVSNKEVVPWRHFKIGARLGEVK